ncbi:MAG: hypothetical protein A2186_01530 [Candidatus Levybacteria bacterium RIFOXYA1_FULL_41_10]|nr:MAG: hypothetical protein A2695_00610 [Candidatus Levybacteria bacterium RIFCSPHIGHO2_01_FULL_40_83]OGH24614.1 MAG: hypothetical protein A3D82_01050 [Candidatus Levybacteria bacterium RIFCSPHIGHO2_02_FULL_40_29]OGH50816.1 MAG: hypothetical protein A3J18_01480 [Candidatus Levybacteria bacterium RIFCSPLOWO2_02_FULL_40_18]OGH52396.1 MAG: hypothetical protein A3H20_00845 [Candidatus Levybacteria bacterium RIFCSPLOWO2_12_FULL_41_12]OGH53496.1 MAG: hypothetical protein A2423_04070 [Candidatus Levy
MEEAMPRGKLTAVKESLEDNLLWNGPQSVGTARVLHVEHPMHDMVFIDCGGDDITAHEFVFTAPGKIKKNQIVEVIVRTKKQLRKPFTFPDCQVAIRPYTQETYGKITAEDRATLRPTFEYDSNRKDAFFSRAFYRRFFPGGRSTLKPFPDVSGSE